MLCRDPPWRFFFFVSPAPHPPLLRFFVRPPPTPSPLPCSNHPLCAFSLSRCGRFRLFGALTELPLRPLVAEAGVISRTPPPQPFLEPTAPPPPPTFFFCLPGPQTPVSSSCCFPRRFFNRNEYFLCTAFPPYRTCTNSPLRSGGHNSPSQPCYRPTLVELSPCNQRIEQGERSQLF